MISRLGSETITVLRGASRNTFGDTAGTATETDIAGCSVQPGSSAEQTGQGDLIVSALIVFAPAGADILATDQVRYSGTVYAVDGDPARWVDRLGRESHVQAVLKIVKGSD